MDNAVISVCIQAETTFSQLFLEGTSSMRISKPTGHDSFREFVFAPAVGEVVLTPWASFATAARVAWLSFVS